VYWHALGSAGRGKGGFLVNGISASATLISLFLGLAAVRPGQAEDYFIYRDPDGKLVISNKKPPLGSMIIRQRELPEFAETQSGKTPSGPAEVPSKLSKSK